MILCEIVNTFYLILILLNNDGENFENEMSSEEFNIPRLIYFVTQFKFENEKTENIKSNELGLGVIKSQTRTIPLS